MRTMLFMVLFATLPTSALEAGQSSSLPGRWDCQGEDGATVLDFQSSNRLIYDGEENAYRIQGNAVNIRLVDGSELRAQVNTRQNDGRITELMINGKLWATG